MTREFPLDPDDPEYEVRYAPEAVRELADLDEPEELMDELEARLGVDPHRPPGRRARKLQDAEVLWRYRPHADDALRVLYAVEGDEVWILAVEERDGAYRRGNIETALDRLRRADDGDG